jgi:hypothetical protein
VGLAHLADVRLWLQELIAIAVFVVVLRIPRLLNNQAGYAVTPLAVGLWAARMFSSGGAAAAGPAAAGSSGGSAGPNGGAVVSAAPPLASAGGGAPPPSAPGGRP